MSAPEPSAVSALPAWPEDMEPMPPAGAWVYRDRDAYRARMEALAAEVEQLRDEFLLGNPRYAEWLEIINALLAACERGDR